MERVYVVQHPENAMLFYTHTADRWTLELDKAHGFRTEQFALRAIANHLNGKGHVIPYLRPIETGRQLRERVAREQKLSV